MGDILPTYLHLFESYQCLDFLSLSHIRLPRTARLHITKMFWVHSNGTHQNQEAALHQAGKECIVRKHLQGLRDWMISILLDIRCMRVKLFAEPTNHEDKVDKPVNAELK